MKLYGRLRSTLRELYEIRAKRPDIISGSDVYHIVKASVIMEEINRAGARITREAFGGRPLYVLGDVGPLGAFLEPLGDLSLSEAQVALEEQCAALVGAGVDAIIIETQAALEEVGLAIDAAKAARARRASSPPSPMTARPTAGPTGP